MLRRSIICFCIFECCNYLIRVKSKRYPSQRSQAVLMQAACMQFTDAQSFFFIFIYGEGSLAKALDLSS